MLTLTDLTLSYGSFRALEGISLHADSGELVVLSHNSLLSSLWMKNV